MFLCKDPFLLTAHRLRYASIGPPFWRSTMFTSLMPLLPTHQLERTIAFCRDRLGFECAQRSQHWALVERDSITPTIATPNAHEPFDAPGLHRFALFLD